MKFLTIFCFALSVLFLLSAAADDEIMPEVMDEVQEVELLTMDQIKALPTKTLRTMLKTKGQECMGCTEKADYFNPVFESQSLPDVLEEEKPPPKIIKGDMDDIMEQLKKSGFGGNVFSADDLKGKSDEELAAKFGSKPIKKSRKEKREEKAKEDKEKEDKKEKMEKKGKKEKTGVKEKIEKKEKKDGEKTTASTKAKTTTSSSKKDKDSTATDKDNDKKEKKEKKKSQFKERKPFGSSNNGGGDSKKEKKKSTNDKKGEKRRKEDDAKYEDTIPKADPSDSAWGREEEVEEDEFIIEL